MAKIIFTSNLERHCHCPTKIVVGNTVIEVLKNYFSEYPAIQSYVLDDQDKLRKNMLIAVNNEIISDRVTLLDPVKENDEVFVLQALSGG